MIRLRREIVSRASDGLDGLKCALQAAIELEHATIPPYLYALYSVKQGSNLRMAEIIRSVVLEEMLHLALACNLLNAIGGKPSLDRLGFIPSYPCPLPGSVGEIVVPLAPISKTVLRDVFMEIEEPEAPLVFPVLGTFGLTLPPSPTIGQFYHTIKNQFIALATEENIFVGAPGRQLGNGLPGMRRVTDLQSAKDVIDLIVEQGEGARLSPLNPATQPAHYYSFAAAYHGRELVPQEGVPPFAYAGDPILLDEAGIIPFVTNPRPEQYAGTAAAALNDRFNSNYTKVLKTLQRTFDGSPLSIFGAVTQMKQLPGDVAALAQIEVAPGVFAGPTFTYSP